MGNRAKLFISAISAAVAVVAFIFVAFIVARPSSPTQVMEQYEDGLEDQASDLGWVQTVPARSYSTLQPAEGDDQSGANRPSRAGNGEEWHSNLYQPNGSPEISSTGETYLDFGRTVRSKLALVVNSLARAKRNWSPTEGSGLNNVEMAEILKSLATYAPLASDAEERLSQAMAARVKRAKRLSKASSAPTLEYGRVIQDEYDAAAQYPPAPKDQYGAATQATLQFDSKDVPKLSCGPVDPESPAAPYSPRMDRLDDCVLKPLKTYNKMYSLDRLRAGAPPATPAEVHAHMQGVKRFARKWRPLLVGDGGGDGPGAFDDPYYLCYDQYQEDPEFTQCLHDLAADGSKGPFAVHKWAADDGRGATHSVMGKEEERVGFPELDKEWKKELKHDPSGQWVRLNKESGLTPDGGTWVPLAADNPAKGEVGPKHATPYPADALPSPVDGVIGG